MPPENKPSSEAVAEPPARNRHYLRTIRQSYGTLMHASHVLEASRATEDKQGYRREIAETVAAFVHTLVWADEHVRAGESEAIAGLIEEDQAHGGFFSNAIRDVPNTRPNLVSPHFLTVCGDYDRVHRTRLLGTTINALESLGLSLLAVDWEITDEEMALLQSLVKGWREEESRISPVTL